MDLELKINTLEKKVKQLIEQYHQLQQNYKALLEEVNQKSIANKDLKLQLSDFENRYKSLQIANTILGSDTDKRETKLKINALIRDLDLCIAQLSA